MSVTNSLTNYNYVIVKPHKSFVYENWENKNFKYEGTVKCIKYHYKNRGVKHYGKEKFAYIGFNDSSAYDNLLLIGSMIFCYVHGALLNCYIFNITKNETTNRINTIEVAIYDDEDTITIYPLTYKIDKKDIESMLISEKAFMIEQL